MDQLSLPYRVALAGLLVVVIAWMTVLRPKSEDTSAPVTPVVKATPAAKAPAPAAKPKAVARAAVATDAATPILNELATGRTAVLVFYGEGSDDAAVREAAARVDRHDGQVLVQAAPVERVGEFGSITRGVDVTQSPTLLVIGADRKAREITGFTDTGEIDQLVDDVRAGQLRG